MLGKGAFGRVFKGLNVKTGQFVAVKELTITDKDFVREELPNVLAEIQVWYNAIEDLVIVLMLRSLSRCCANFSIQILYNTLILQ